jgi:phosphatidate cytidylyltransferase
MRERLLLGPILIAALIGGLWLDEWLGKTPMPWSQRGAPFPSGILVFIFSVVLATLAARELAAIFASKGVEASRRILTTSAWLGLAASCLVPSGFAASAAVGMVGSAAVLVLLLSLGFYSRHKSVEGVAAATGAALVSFVYLGLMMGFMPAMRQEHSAWLLLWVLLVTKSCDIGAYFAGKAFGKHKLIPWLSPGKTWEGLLGGVIMSAIVSVAGLEALRSWGVIPGVPVWAALLPGVLFAIVGQTGDLLESMLKRDAGLKDSGHALPGFGGVLDVLDSALLVAPLAFWMLKAFAKLGWV